jgi:hypothetical protein
MKDWNLVKGVYKDEAIFQLINNFKILVLNIKKIIATLSIVVVSGLIIYGFILVQQIFADNTKFTESQVYIYVPTDANYSEVKN